MAGGFEELVQPFRGGYNCNCPDRYRNEMKPSQAKPNMHG